jgi:hypothetical protein
MRPTTATTLLALLLPTLSLSKLTTAGGFLVDMPDPSPTVPVLLIVSGTVVVPSETISADGDADTTATATTTALTLASFAPKQPNSDGARPVEGHAAGPHRSFGQGMGGACSVALVVGVVGMVVLL